MTHSATFLGQITSRCGARRIAKPEVLGQLYAASATLQVLAPRVYLCRAGSWPGRRSGLFSHSQTQQTQRKLGR